MNMKLTAFLAIVIPVAVVAGTPSATVQGVEAKIMDGKARVDISLVFKGARIVDFNMFASSISRFVNDKGDKLGVNPGGEQQQVDYETMPIYASAMSAMDGEGRIITVTSPANVTPGASKFALEGELVVQYAESLESNVIQGLRIQNGVELTMGGLKGKVEDVRRGKDMEFDFKFEDAREDIKFEEVEIRTVKGEEFPSSGGPSTSRVKVGDGLPTINMSFWGFKPPADAVNVGYQVWRNLKTMKIPYKVVVSTEGAAPAAQAAPDPAESAVPEAAPSRDPVQPQAAAPVPSSPATSTLDWPALKITGVMGKGKTGTAIINGQYLNPGESIEGVLVESIAGGMVTLKYKNKTVKLASGNSVP